MKHFRIKVLIAIIWLIFTVSLAGWWFIHAWDQIGLASHDSARSMLKWEGFSLLFALLAGGAAIFYLIYQERSSYRTLNDFHMAFSHDLKNAMTSLQMQVGALQDEQQGEQNPILMRLDQDSRRLKMKLENSLELSKSNAVALHMQDISLSDILGRVRFHEPDIEITLNHDRQVFADRRVLELIFINIINNAVKHGNASRVDVEVKPASGGNVELRFCDNGEGFEGRRDQLSKMYYSSNSSNGSGIGLFLVKKLVTRMRGNVAFPQSEEDEGFVVLLTLEQGRGNE